ncbi:MAG: c-type cytochrome [Rhodospirillales bacterium]
MPDFKYAPAFAGLAVMWDDKNPDEFFAAPAKLAPGTIMVVGVPQAAGREDLVACLKTLK